MSYYNKMDQSLASGYDFTLVYGPEDSHYMQLFGKDYIYISTIATSRMDMFCSTLHEVGHMFAFRQGKDWSDESLAWEIGAKLNKLMGFPIPQPYYDKKVEQHLSFLEEDDESIDWDAFYARQSGYDESNYDNN
jgi:hypothetical protein